MSLDDKTAIYFEAAENILASFDGKSAKEKYCKIAKILDLSEKAVYNKFTGRSRLTMDEIVVLAQKSQISLDQMVLKTSIDKSYIPFYSDGLKYSPREYHEYIYNINHYFTKIKVLQNIHGYFLANEIPLFHFLDFPQLMYLKLYIWNTINWNIENHPKEYNPSVLEQLPEFKNQCRLLQDSFRSFESTEIWNPSMLHNTLEQWNYLIAKGKIKDPKIISAVYNELHGLIDSLEQMTETGKKPVNARNNSHPTNILLTGLNMGSEIIIVKSDTNAILFQQLDVPNYLRTTDDKMIDKAWSYFANIKKTATSITESGDKEKSIFFNQLRSSVETVFHKI